MTDTRRTPESKIVSYEQIGRISDEYRNEKKKIVFTNGCFDVVHPGHVYCLYKASREGDLLVVGLNSDDSVHRIKGPTRPILPQNERAELLASFFFVDYVVIFDESTPIELIKRVRPKVLVKGGDYHIGTIIGADEVIRDGGRIVVEPQVPNFSSTNIINNVMK